MDKDLIAKLAQVAKSYTNQPEALAPIQKQMEQLQPEGPPAHLDPNSAVYKKNLYLRDLAAHDQDRDGIDDRIEDRDNNGIDDIIDARLEASLDAMDNPRPRPKQQEEQNEYSNVEWLEEEPEIAFIGDTPEGDHPAEQEVPKVGHDIPEPDQALKSPFRLPSARDKPRPNS